MESFIFQDLIIILGLSILVLLIGHRFQVPPIVGFLLTGLLCGPHGLGLIEKPEDVEMLAQIGILLLLFGIGMEFSIKRLIQIKRWFLVGGSLQVGLTAIAGILIGWLLGRPLGESVFLGCLLSMSSTAIVLRLLEQRGETASPQGRLAISMLIFQDIVAIPMILFTPLLGQSTMTTSFDASFIWLLIAGVAVLIVVFFSAEQIVPQLLLMVARTRNKELFLLSVLALCFGVAWLTSSIGLSLTIGAFLAGLIISESEYSNEAVGNIFPFQALFISFFFVSIGMLLDVHFVMQQPFLILMLALGILLLKTCAAAIAVLFLGMPIRTAILVGLSLCQIGEFSFVLAKTGTSFGLAPGYYYQLFLAVALFTMAISPILIKYSHLIAEQIAKLPWPKTIKTGSVEHDKGDKQHLKDHVIILGFGVSGKNLARSSKVAGIPYAILEMNPDTVSEYKLKGEPIYFGDATHLSVLEHLHLYNAQVLAVLINDPLAAKRIVKMARDIHPHLYIIVRVRYVQEMAAMVDLGADEAIPDEFGTSIEIFSRVLKQYHVPEEEVQDFIDEIRADGYELLRNQQKQPTKLSDVKLDLSHIEIGAFRLHANSPLAGGTLASCQLRTLYGLTVLLIRRAGAILSNPAPTEQLLVDDVVVVVGEKITLAKNKELFGTKDGVLITG